MSARRVKGRQQGQVKHGSAVTTIDAEDLEVLAVHFALKHDGLMPCCPNHVMEWALHLAVTKAEEDLEAAGAFEDQEGGANAD